MAKKPKPPGYWEKEENTIAEARKFMKEHDFETIPSSGKLNGLGYSGLSNAISKYHGGFQKIQETLWCAAGRIWYLEKLRIYNPTSSRSHTRAWS